MALSIGIDIGGTFTDIVALDSDSGALTFTKVPSTPANFADGFFAGLAKVIGLAGRSGDAIARLIHGTTVATNGILEAKGAKIAILTTEGFEDVIIFGRQGRSEMYGLSYDPETPTFLCDRQRIIGIAERVDETGHELVPLDERALMGAVERLVEDEGAEAFAVCFLFSYLDPSHERRAAELIHARYPHVRVSLSSTINRRFREYERTVITAFDAYVGPRMERYIKGLEAGMRERRIDVVLQVMQSRGGITNAAMCIEKPVITLLSGLAAGVAGGIFVGKLAGRENLITLDMGGTSNDVALVRHGKPHLSIEGKIGKYPLRQAMVDVSTIGAGGGSIARVDAGGGMKVGPESAGADPGPACYGRGGVEPTVTDASVVLGYLNPSRFAGGELSLDAGLARQAVDKYVAQPLGMSVAEAAAGIHRIVNSNMANQIRLVSVYKGYHPRDFSLVAFGGGGPIVAGRLMQQLEMKEVIVPVGPGVLSAFGLLVADIEHEEVASYAARADEVDPDEIATVFRRLGRICDQKREGVGISLTQLRVYRSAEMRYVGQGYEIEVPFPTEEAITKDTIAEVVSRFHEVHQSIYQHCAPEAPVEFMAFRTVFAQQPQPTPTLRPVAEGPSAGPESFRPAYFDEYRDFVSTPVYERQGLVPGQRLAGPAIVEQSDTTTVLYPNQVAEVDRWGNIIVSQEGDLP